MRLYWPSLPHPALSGLLLLIFLGGGAVGWWWWKADEYRHPTAQQTYDVYYQHFYDSYIQTLPANQAKYYADYYADYYVSYYTSEAYERALQYALPVYSNKALQYPENTAISRYRISYEGLSVIKYFEGYRADPYQDAGGKLTIGYGHLVRPGEYYTALTEAEAEALLRRDVLLAEAIVKREVRVPLSPQQFSALVSLVFNIGGGHFADSTLLRKLNRRNYAGAANEFLRWNKVGQQELLGLSRRREQERALFLTRAG